MTLLPLVNNALRLANWSGALLLTAFLATAAQDVIAADVQIMKSPAGKSAGLSRLTVDRTGTVYLSWVETKNNESSLFYSSLHEYSPIESVVAKTGTANSSWSEAELIHSGENWFINWADFPSLLVNRTSTDKAVPWSMAAHWLELSGKGSYDYDIRAKFYDGDTQSWSSPITIHSDGVKAEHGFVSMVPMNHNRTLIAWLDGRNTVKTKDENLGPMAGSTPASPEHEMDHGSGGMTLRAATFFAGGEIEQEWELDPLVCDCCQTSSAMTQNGPVVVYRDRSEAEVRDIYITRLLKNGWSEPKPVFSDQWKIAGCPVNGPSVVSDTAVTAVTWFTAKDNRPQVKMALSYDGGLHFLDPIIVSQHSTLGRVSSAILESGDIVVSWLEATGSEAILKIARYDSQGSFQESILVAKTQASRRSGFPIMASRSDTVFITWTDVSDESKVEVARIQFSN